MEEPMDMGTSLRMDRTEVERLLKSDAWKDMTSICEFLYQREVQQLVNEEESDVLSNIIKGRCQVLKGIMETLEHDITYLLTVKEQGE